MAIKSRLGKLKLPDDLHNFVAEQVRINALEVLPIEMTHALQVYSLPAHHLDPFDLSSHVRSGTVLCPGHPRHPPNRVAWRHVSVLEQESAAAAGAHHAVTCPG